MNTEEFIKKSKSIHCDMYCYDAVVYVKPTIKVDITCISCKTEFSVRPYDHFTTGCKVCQYKRLPQNQPRTNDTFLEKAREMHGNTFEYLSTYVNKRGKITMKCNVCDTIFQQRAHSHLEGYGCKQCAYNNNPANQIKYTVEQFELLCKTQHEDKYEYFQDFKGVNTKISIRCKKHDSIFTQLGYAHLGKGHGCPRCKESQGEKLISEWLNDNNINYITQKTFPGLRGINPYRFDFYILETNTIIEYDGPQHFKPVKFFGGIENYDKLKRSDKAKTDYCAISNIPLIRISFKQNIIDELKKIIKPKNIAA